MWIRFSEAQHRAYRALCCAFALLVACGGSSSSDGTRTPIERDSDGRWTAASASAWYDAQPWLVGANFSPLPSAHLALMTS